MLKSFRLVRCDAWCLPSTLVTADIKWLIIGSQTKPYRPPELSWVEYMVEVADKAGVKVFLKNNLRPMFETPTGIIRGNHWIIKNNKLELRQEFPA